MSGDTLAVVGAMAFMYSLCGLGIALALVPVLSRPRKSACPMCGATTTAKQILVKDKQTNQNVEMQNNPFKSMIWGILMLVLGLICVVGVGYLVYYNMTDEDCKLEALTWVCTSYSGGTVVETRFGVLLALGLLIGFTALTVTGWRKLLQGIHDKKSPKTHDFLCKNCGNKWDETTGAAVPVSS